MKTATHTCPHCGSHDNRLLADHLGRVNWCRNCHQVWLPDQYSAAAHRSTAAIAGTKQRA